NREQRRGNPAVGNDFIEAVGMTILALKQELGRICGARRADARGRGLGLKGGRLGCGSARQGQQNAVLYRQIRRSPGTDREEDPTAGHTGYQNPPETGQIAGRLADHLPSTTNRSTSALANLRLGVSRLR